MKRVPDTQLQALKPKNPKPNPPSPGTSLITLGDIVTAPKSINVMPAYVRTLERVCKERKKSELMAFLDNIKNQGIRDGRKAFVILSDDEDIETWNTGMETFIQSLDNLDGQQFDMEGGTAPDTNKATLLEVMWTATNDTAVEVLRKAIVELAWEEADWRRLEWLGQIDLFIEDWQAKQPKWKDVEADATLALERLENVTEITSRWPASLVESTNHQSTLSNSKEDGLPVAATATTMPEHRETVDSDEGSEQSGAFAT